MAANKTRRNQVDETTKAPESADNTRGNRPRLTREQREARQAARIERNMKLAQEPDVRVIRVADPGANTMATILRSFAPAFDELKNRLGMPGNRGVAFDAGIPLVERAVKLLVDFSCLTADVNAAVNYTYVPPRELLEQLPQAYQPQKNREAV